MPIMCILLTVEFLLVLNDVNDEYVYAPKVKKKMKEECANKWKNESKE